MITKDIHCLLIILLISLCLSFPFTVLFGTPVCVLSCCAFFCLGHATTFQSHHGCFLPVPYSGYRILSLFSFDTPATISLCPHWVHFTLTAFLSFAEFSLHLYTSRHWVYQIFFSCSPEINPCPQFSCILVPLYLYPLHSTNVTTFYLVFHPCSSRAAPLRGISLSLQYSYVFLYKKYASLSSLSQMATYWFVITWFDNQSVQKSEVRQVAKDVVKSEVYPQTYSP